MVMLRDEDVLTKEVLDWEGLHVLHFAGSSCSQKTRIFLGLKGIEWTSHEVNLVAQENYGDWFMGINPRGLVPVLVDDGRVVIESNDILAYLEARFPEPVLIPPDRADEMAALLEAEDDLHLDLRAISFRYFFPGAGPRPRELQDQYQAAGSGTVGGEPDPHKAVELAFYADVTANGGISDARLLIAVERFATALAALEARLADGAYLMGGSETLLDIAWYIYCFRLVTSGYPLHERHPRLGAWFEGDCTPGRRSAARPRNRRRSSRCARRCRRSRRRRGRPSRRSPGCSVAALVVLNVLLTAGILVALGYRRLAAKSPPPPLFHMLNSVYGLLRPDCHTGRPTPAPRIAEEMRYPPVEPPPDTASRHGEIEVLPDGTEATHWYAEAAGVTWHFVTAGDPGGAAVLMLHGLPESWWAFHHQVGDLAKDRYVIALDCKGYGQSDKRLDLDYRAATMAAETAALLDALGIERFHIVAHDRGAVIADHMTAVASLEGRILRYVRMQQSFNEPHGDPRPPHALFATRLGEANFKSRNIIGIVYEKVMPTGLTPSTLKRLDYEFKFRGVAEAVRRYFGVNNFDIEYRDRHESLFAHMTMPILILQGRWDPGQHPEEYARSSEFAPDLRVEFVEASHFSHLENPTAVNGAIRRFLGPA